MIIFNALQTSLSGGIGRYCYELSKEIYKTNLDIKIVIREEDKELFHFLREEDMIIIKGINSGVKRNLFEQFKLPFIINKIYPDAIIHYPDSMAPILSKNKVIITIHDIAFRALKDVFTLKTRVWKNFVTFFSIKKAIKIIAISEYTKEEILKFYGDELKDKIDVVYNGFNDFSSEIIELDNVRSEIKDLINKKYILTVSTISPRKNMDGLIRAYNKTKCKKDVKLVIAGGKGWLFQSVFDLVTKLKLSKHIVFTDKVNEDELKFLYKNCDIFTYLSLYEGFGLPPLEAMSYKKTCIVSNTSSIPEVVLDSAISVNPKNLNEIAEALDLTYYEEGIRKKYEELSKKNVLRFSWEKCAEDTARVYKNN